MGTFWKRFSRRYGARVVATSWLLGALCVTPLGSLWAAIPDDSDLNAARRPHADLPPGRRDHAAAVVDEYFREYWANAEVRPAPIADDATFLRRASLTLNGIPATSDELSAFIADPSPLKRARKVEELLTRSRYADYWGFRLRNWITDLREVKGQGVSLRNLYWYTREAMAENRSWKRVAQDLLTSQGNPYNDGSVNFSLYFDVKPNEFGDAAARFFLGSNLSCAQCHDHPTIDDWKRETYWSLAAYFARAKFIRFKPDEREKEFPGTGRSPSSVSTLPGGDRAIDGGGGEERVILDVEEGELSMPDPGNPSEEGPTPVFPTPLGGPRGVSASAAPSHASWGGAQTRREQLVAWMTATENPYFARTAVNRFWIEIVGRGFVERADGFAPNVVVRHEPLLERLSQLFAEEGYDIKWLLRTIVLSRLFQLEHVDGLAAADVASETVARTWHAAPQRRLNSDQWFDSVLRVTGEEKRIYTLADEIAPLLTEEHNARIAKRERLTTHAVVALAKGKYSQLVQRIAVATFKPEPLDDKLSEKARADLEPKRKSYSKLGKKLQKLRGQARVSMSPTSEALMRMNGKLVSWALENGTAADGIAALERPEERLETVFQTVLNRSTDAAEGKRLKESVREPGPAAIVDLLWALMQTTEFQTY